MALGVGEQLVLTFFFIYAAFSYLPFYGAILTIVLFLATYFWKLNYDKNYWSRQGIPGPKPHILLGNLKEFTKGMHIFDSKFIQMYGSTFGSYIFSRPDLVSDDLDFIRQVLVKDFNHFEDRTSNIDNNPSDKWSLYQNKLTSMKGEDWKRIRHTVTPAFTTGKLKRLVPIFKQSAKELCEYLDEFVKCGKSVPLKDTLGRLTMSVIGRSAFAVDIDTFQNEETPFIKYTNKYFNNHFTFMHPLYLFQMLFPNVANFIKTQTKRQILNQDVHSFFYNILSGMLDERKKDKNSSKKYQDFFQLLIEASLDENSQINDALEDPDIIHNEISKSKNKGLSKAELLAQSFVVLIAGYETTAFTLQMIIYVLAKMPEIQEKMRDEIKEVIGEKTEFDYEDVAKLKYMQQVVQEALRMYPPAARTGRICTTPTTINGIHFEKDISFSVPIYRIHYDERYYPEPNKFDPDRFSPEEKAARDPLTFLPFGYGPRNCIGMRFALIEIWLTLTYLIKDFRISPAPGSPDLPLQIATNKGLTRAVDTLYVQVERI